MQTLKEIRKLYSTGELFFTATKNCKIPMKIGTISFAEHEDRRMEILNIKQWCLDVYRDMYPTRAKDKFEKLKYAFQNNIEFFNKTKEKIERMNYLLSLGKDIVNSEGGLIYCSETNTFAEKC